MSAKNRIRDLIGFFVIGCLSLPCATFAQFEDPAPENGGNGEEGLRQPRNNVRGGSVASRAPGNWINTAIGRHSERQNAMLRNFGGANYNRELEESRLRENILITLVEELEAAIVNVALAILDIDTDDDDGDDDDDGEGNGQDQDEDNVLDDVDNCPNTPNNDQLDSDDDGVGDACDACPDTLPDQVVTPDGCPFAPVQEVFVENIPDIRYLTYDRDDPTQEDDTFDFLYAGCNGAPCSPVRIDLLADEPEAQQVLPATMQMTYPAGVAYSEDPVVGLIDPVEDVLLTNGFETEATGFWWIDPESGFKNILPTVPGEDFPDINPASLRAADIALDSRNRVVFLDHITQGLFRLEDTDQGLAVNRISQLIPEDQVAELDLDQTNRFGNIAIDAEDNIYVYAADQVLRLVEETEAGEFVTSEVDLQIGGESLECQDAFMPMAFGPGGLWQNTLYIICDGVLYRVSDDDEALPLVELASDGLPADMLFSDARTLYVSELPTTASDFTTGRIIRLFFDCNDNGVFDSLEDDTDEDGWIDECDNCPQVSNPGQADADGDGTGDACE
jgi:hypothetical protein